MILCHPVAQDARNCVYRILHNKHRRMRYNLEEISRALSIHKKCLYTCGECEEDMWISKYIPHERDVDLYIYLHTLHT